MLKEFWTYEPFSLLSRFSIFIACSTLLLDEVYIQLAGKHPFLRETIKCYFRIFKILSHDGSESHKHENYFFLNIYTGLATAFMCFTGKLRNAMYSILCFSSAFYVLRMKKSLSFQEFHFFTLIEPCWTIRELLNRQKISTFTRWLLFSFLFF